MRRTQADPTLVKLFESHIKQAQVREKEAYLQKVADDKYNKILARLQKNIAAKNALLAEKLLLLVKQTSSYLLNSGSRPDYRVSPGMLVFPSTWLRSAKYRSKKVWRIYWKEYWHIEGEGHTSTICFVTEGLGIDEKGVLYKISSGNLYPLDEPKEIIEACSILTPSKETILDTLKHKLAELVAEQLV